MLRKFIALTLMLIPLSALSNWNTFNEVDDFTDETTKFLTYNDDNHAIQIQRNQKTGYVWLYITKKNIDTFEPNSIIEMRVDNNTTRSIDPAFLKRLSAGTGQVLYHWEPKTIAFSIWHGKEEQGRACGFVSELLAGNELRIRYRISSIEASTLRVNLEGINQALIDTLNLKVCH
ncbi:hypothetical protein [Vibrio sp.]|uniref:hypothetical protein n=1 Tax=Vibrio sp. TaxID=678 RepID=UPI003D143233